MPMKDREQLIEQIAADLFNEDVLDLDNFGNDYESLIYCVREVIEKALRDYILIQGRIL